MITIISSWIAVLIQIFILFLFSYQTLDRDIFLILGMFVMSKLTDSSDQYSILFIMTLLIFYTITYASFPTWNVTTQGLALKIIDISFRYVIPILIILWDLNSIKLLKGKKVKV